MPALESAQQLSRVACGLGGRCRTIGGIAPVAISTIEVRASALMRQRLVLFRNTFISWWGEPMGSIASAFGICGALWPKRFLRVRSGVPAGKKSLPAEGLAAELHVVFGLGGDAGAVADHDDEMEPIAAQLDHRSAVVVADDADPGEFAVGAVARSLASSKKPCDSKAEANR